MIPVATYGSVDYALRWLSRHQNHDGSWGATGFKRQCADGGCVGDGDSEYDVGLTGLALLAYFGAGYTHESKDRHPDTGRPTVGGTVRDGLLWLMSKQDPEGCVGGRGLRFMYSHALATLALSEAYRASPAPPLRAAAQRAVEFLVASQNRGGGWRYSVSPGDNDTSVTGWSLMALRSAELAGLDVPVEQAYGDALLWLDEATDVAEGYRVGYNTRGYPPRRPMCKEIIYPHHDTMTAIAVLCRTFVSKDEKDPAFNGVKLLLADLPTSKSKEKDYYYWFFGSLALFQFDGPAGAAWRTWNQPVKDALLPHQVNEKGGCARGSWTSDDDRWGFEGGRVYATAINALTLEVYYRYQNVFPGSK